MRALDLRLNLMGMGAFIASYIARYGRIEMMPDLGVVEVVRARDRVVRSCGARSAAGCETLPPSTRSWTSSGSGWRWWYICVGLWVRGFDVGSGRCGCYVGILDICFMLILYFIGLGVCMLMVMCIVVMLYVCLC